MKWQAEWFVDYFPGAFRLNFIRLRAKIAKSFSSAVYVIFCVLRYFLLFVLLYMGELSCFYGILSVLRVTSHFT